MTEKFFVSFNKTNSFDDLTDIKLSKKVDILFIDSKIEDNDKFCLTYNSNNSIKDLVPFEEFAKISAKILLFRVVTLSLNARDLIYNKLSQNLNDFKNTAIIYFVDCQYAIPTLDFVFKGSDNLSQIVCNLISCGISGEIFFVDNEAKLINFVFTNSFNTDKYYADLAEKWIKISINSFSQFISQQLPSYSSEINEINTLLLTNFITENQHFYLKNFFLSKEFITSSQIINPDNFSVILNEIINYYKKVESSSFIIFESFIENCLIPANIDKINQNDMVLTLKRINVLAKIFDKISVILQMSLVASFQNCLNHIKSANIGSFLIIFFYENIIFSESKLFFINNLKKNKYLSNRGIEISNIFSKNQVNYKSLFDQESDFSFSDLTSGAYFSCLEKDNFLNIACSYEKTFHPLKMIFRKKFINFIIEKSALYTIKNMVKYVEENFDDIEKNRIRDGVSKAIFSRKFVDNNFEKIRAIYRLIPIEVQQFLPKELAPSKNKSKLFD